MSHHILLALAQLLIVAFAQYQIDPETCVDPSGFQKCYSDAQSGGGQCQAGCDALSSTNICVLGCGCEYLTIGINCALTHCWNQVYSCGYQALAIGALSVCASSYTAPNAPIPYFPAPPNAPGGCSCNIGAAYESIIEYNQLSVQCAKLGVEFPFTLAQFTCACCTISGIFSSFADICPQQNTYDIPGYLNPQQFIAAASGASVGCDQVLTTATCTAAPYNLPTPIQAVTPQFYALGAIPTPGTESISNNPGGLSSPTSGDVLTWTIDNVPQVVTAVKSTDTSGTTGVAELTPWRVLAILSLGTFVMLCLG